MTKTDDTFSTHSAFGSLRWVAATLGRSEAWVSGAMDSLLSEGFPRRDPVIGLWLKDDVTAWVKGRRKIPFCDMVAVGTESVRINHDAL